MSKPFLIILCGLPFSGKTTLAQKISEKLACEIVAFDWLWAKEFPNGNPDPDKINEWKIIRKIAKEKIADLLKHGKSVVYDEVNPRFEHREEFRKIVKDLGLDAKVVFVDVSLAEIKKRKAANILYQERHNVAQENFIKAVSDFEKPEAVEQAIVVNSSDDIDTLADKI